MRQSKHCFPVCNDGLLLLLLPVNERLISLKMTHQQLHFFFSLLFCTINQYPVNVDSLGWSQKQNRDGKSADSAAPVSFWCSQQRQPEWFHQALVLRSLCLQVQTQPQILLLPRQWSFTTHPHNTLKEACNFHEAPPNHKRALACLWSKVK